MLTPLNIVLVHPEIPHNTGAVGRLCVGLDCQLHIIRPIGFALTDGQLKRAGMDYWQHLRLKIHDNWDAFLDAEAPAQIWLASTHGSTSLYDVAFSSDTYIIFGNESSGLPDFFHEQYQDKRFCIPMPGAHSRSLNLANAVAVVAYEAYRQITALSNA